MRRSLLSSLIFWSTIVFFAMLFVCLHTSQVVALDLRPTLSPWSEDGTNIYQRVARNVCIGVGPTATDALSLCTAPVASATRALLNLSNTALSGGSANGTYLGANPAACAGSFWDFQLANAARSTLTCAGALSVLSSPALGIMAGTSLATTAGIRTQGGAYDLGAGGSTTEGHIEAQGDVAGSTGDNVGQLLAGGFTNRNLRVIVGMDTTNSVGFISATNRATGNLNLILQPAGDNVKIAGTATRATTAGTNHLSIFDGTAPVGTLANGITLYSTAGELRAMDAGGTATLLSPHPNAFLGTLPVEGRPHPWAYASENSYLGTTIVVDMAGMVAAVEQLSGKRFVTLSSLPTQGDWDTDQTTIEREETTRRAQALGRLVQLEEQISRTADSRTREDLLQQKARLTIPPLYQKRGPPKWLRDRGVQSALP